MTAARGGKRSRLGSSIKIQGANHPSETVEDPDQCQHGTIMVTMHGDQDLSLSTTHTTRLTCQASSALRGTFVATTRGSKAPVPFAWVLWV